MKPCSSNRKPIAWLAVQALDHNQERELRAHLEVCEGCRRYFDEIANVTHKLAVTEVRSDIDASPAFHQKVVAAIRGEEPESFVAHFRALLNRRVALPVVAATALIALGTSIYTQRHTAPPTVPAVPYVAIAPKKMDFDPTLSNYQTIAKRSLDRFDEILTREANRNPSSAPIYTASTLTSLDSLD